MLSGEGTKPGQLALAVYCQLEADVDDGLAAQTIKCLVHLSKEMLEADRAAGLIPTALESSLHGEPPAASDQRHGSNKNLHTDTAQLATDAGGQNGTEAADSEAESEDEQDRQELGLAGVPGLTLQGLVRRMAKMAGDRCVWQ